MERFTAYHRSTPDMCWAADEKTVVIRVRTDKSADRATLMCSDPFINELTRKKSWYGKPFDMTLDMELEDGLIWRAQIKPPFRRLQYYFRLFSGDKEYLLFDNKLCVPEERDKSSELYYKFPWINPSDVFSAPQWVRDTVWYQIMPDRFCRSERSGEVSYIAPWGKPTRKPHHTYYGGDLKGMTERLPYLKELGIGGIYLTPVFLSGSYHRYNTYDYKKIDPLLGDEDDMRAFVDRAHELGINIMLDGVFNHCGTEFFAWKDVCARSRASEYYDWFFINDEDFVKPRFDTADGRYFTFSFWAGMPKLNTNYQGVKDYYIDICSYWVREWDIDGIRFDVGDEVSHTFLRELRSALKSVKKDIFLLGEMWFDAINWLSGTEYDSVMNYPMSSCINDFSRKTDTTALSFEYALNRCLMMYPENVTQVLFNFLDTHDTTRVSEECGGNTDLLIQRLTMLFTMPGTPCIYYGTEIALRGRDASDNRSCMPWNEIEQGGFDGILDEVKKLIAIRNDNAFLSGTEFGFIRHEEPRLLHYVRRDPDTGKRIGVCINAGDSAVQLSVDGRVLYSRLFEGGRLDKNGTIIYES